MKYTEYQEESFLGGEIMSIFISIFIVFVFFQIFYNGHLLPYGKKSPSQSML